MTHKPEDVFTEQVIELLEEEFGEEKIEHQKYLPKTERYVDIYVNGDIFDFVIEIENDFEACLKGVGQAIIYAGEVGAIPVVVVPKGHIDEPEASMLNNIINIIEVEV